MGGYDPQNLQSAYEIPTSGGSTHTIALVDAYGYTAAEGDLAKYRERYGLGACTTGNGCFRKVNEKGEEANYPSGNKSWEGESSLDLDMASAACPACHILLVEATSASLADLGTAVNRAASLGSTEISNSYGIAENSCGGRDCEEYNADYDHAGVLVTASSGDAGYDNFLEGGESPAFPAASPYVVAVGGTSLKKASNSRGWAEEVWSEPERSVATGSGCSRSELKPAWQSDTGCSNRTDNDAAAVAACATPVSVYSTPYGGWEDFCGTSASSPLVAGIEAHASEYARSLPGADAFYSDRVGMFDVTTGANEGLDGECTPPTEDEYLCHAEVGYDGPTGTGTPHGPLELASAPPLVATRAASAVTNSTATLNGSVTPQGSATTYHFEYGTTTSYGSSVPLPDGSAGSGTANKAVSVGIASLQSGTTYHYRLLATNSAGSTDGADQMFRTAPPTVTGVTPSSGPTDGGSSVAIAGTNLVGVTSVKFGSVAAKSFKVESETSITAVSAAGTGTADVTVTTPAGTSATGSTDRFTYELGPVLAWGDNQYGQLGDGTNANTDVPVEVGGLSEAGALAAGATHSLALVKNGAVVAWGENYDGELGDGNRKNSQVPVKVCAANVTECPHGPYLEEVAAIAAGDYDSLALMKNGTVMAWGDNYEGQLGNGSSTIYNHAATVYNDTPGPVCVIAESPCKPEHYLKGVVAIAAGGFHSLALLNNGTVMAWGYNEQGQLGIGTATGPEKCDQGFYPCSRTPVAVSVPGEVTAIAAGEEHSLALLSNGAVMAWGQNKEGELGDGSEENSEVPTAVCGAGEKSPCAQHLGEVGAIVAGWGYSLALVKGGTVKAWGGNYEGQLGDGSFSREEPSCSCIRAPVAVSNLSEVGAIAAGDNGTESLALLENGSLMSWGSDRNGALGDANAEGPGGDTDVPVRVCAPDASGPCPQGPYLAGDATAVAVGGDRDLVALNGIGSAPTVLTEAASSITATKATLNASVNPNGSDVSECRLEYATTTSYTSSVACSLPAGSGTDAVAVSASLTGLRANTTYHFRVVARNAVGTSYGSDETFKTLPPAVPTVTTASLPGGRVDSGYSAALAADEGTTPYTWSLSAGSLPSGLHLNAQSGAIVGTPSVAGTFTFTAKVTDSSTPTPQSATGELSITVSAAVGQAAEYGQCKILTNNTTPKVKRGKYVDANCQKLFEKRGKPKAKGGFEWAPGPPPTCERQRKGAFTNNTCTARSIQAHRGAFEQEPGAGYTSAGATITLETPGLGVKVVCGQSEGVGQITSQHAGLERFVLFSCETSGKPCNSEGTDGTPSYQPGVIITNLLQTRLIGPASGEVLTQLISAEHEPYLAEFDCGGARFRTLGSLSGAQSGNANTSSVTSTTTFASGTGEQSIYTELSETEGASWVGPDLSTEATIVTNSAAAKTEIKTT